MSYLFIYLYICLFIFTYHSVAAVKDKFYSQSKMWVGLGWAGLQPDQIFLRLPVTPKNMVR